MGCSKHLVDSENLLRQFAAIGCDFHHNPEALHGDIAVINTCGFIGDAKEESINQILSLVEHKRATSWDVSLNDIVRNLKQKSQK